MFGKGGAGGAYSILRWIRGKLVERVVSSNTIGKDEYVVLIHPENRELYKKMMKRGKLMKQMSEFSVLCSTLDSVKGFAFGGIKLFKDGPLKSLEKIKEELGKDKEVAKQAKRDLLLQHCHAMLKDLHIGKYGEDRTMVVLSEFSKKPIRENDKDSGNVGGIATTTEKNGNGTAKNGTGIKQNGKHSNSSGSVDEPMDPMEFPFE